MHDEYAKTLTLIRIMDIKTSTEEIGPFKPHLTLTPALANPVAAPLFTIPPRPRSARHPTPVRRFCRLSDLLCKYAEHNALSVDNVKARVSFLDSFMEMLKSDLPYLNGKKMCIYGSTARLVI